MPAPSAPTPRRATPRTAGRRAVLGWASAVPVLGLVAGCDADGTPAAPTSSTAAGGTTSASSDQADQADRADQADLALVAEARSRLADQVDLLRRSTRAHRSLREPLAGLLDLHRTHDRRLAGAQPESGSGSASGSASGGPKAPTVPDEATAALGAVRERERSLQRGLVELAGRADSGALAQLFASMAAGVAQRLQRLPDTVGADGSGG